MHWSKKNKGIVIFLIVIVAVVLLCLGDYGLRYYDTPKEETYDYVGSGMLVGLVNPQFYQQVPAAAWIDHSGDMIACSFCIHTMRSS